MTKLTNLLENNANLVVDQIMAEIRYQWSLNHAMHEANLTSYDMVAINQLIDDYGVSYRGASMVREYLEDREDQ